MTDRSTRRALVALVAGNVLGGVGVASGITVGALLVAAMGGTEMAGIGQALSVLGAGLLAVPLAGLATRKGRRYALMTGYAIAALGGVVVVVAAELQWLPLVLLGLVFFGAAQATNLQTRYAASELVAPERRATTMSFVIWATTLGSVLGPNLSGAGAQLGRHVGVPGLAGPFLFSVTGFWLAGLVIGLVYAGRSVPAAVYATPGEPDSAPRVGARAALAWAARHPVARFAVVLIVTGHAVMVGIMSMTPVHLGHTGHGLSAVGMVLSLHILGMYALSPVLGWLADKVGAMRTALAGLILLGTSALMILIAPGRFIPVTVALAILGVGWSATTIAGSALLAAVGSDEIRVPLQGATDALMSYGGAAAALFSGPLLTWLGFGGLAVTAASLILPAAAIGWVARRHRDPALTARDQR